MAYTLAEMVKVEQDPLRKGVMMHLLRKSNIMGVVPWEDVGSLSNIVIRSKTLPSVGWRKLNEGYTESTGKLEQIPETLKILGGDIDIDLVFKKVTNLVEDPEVTQTKLKLAAIAYEFNDTFINGSEIVDEDEFSGLKYRVTNLPTATAARMKLYLDASGDGTGASLKVFASAANTHALLDAIHEAIYKVGGADALFMNENTYLKVSAALRRQGLLDTTRDSFDREINAFNGATMVDVGLKADQSTEIITNAETESSGNDSTSIYAVRFGSDDGLIGIQLERLQAYVAAEELESKPAKRVRIDWPVGLAMFGDRCVARIMGFKMAAS